LRETVRPHTGNFLRVWGENPEGDFVVKSRGNEWGLEQVKWKGWTEGMKDGKRLGDVERR
jgi:hypothetical protein